ncbi:MAG: MFS transporter [Dehalococcoidia bacterium]|nr:MFS transporter [Dehalococcoidia bacterium]
MDEPEAAAAAPQRLAARLTRGETFASLALPQFRFLLAGTALSQIAGWMEEVARGWLVLQLTGSPFQLGLLGFIRGFSQLLVSPLAGVLADRLDRRRLAAITQVVPALDTLLIAVLVTTDHIAMWQLYPLVCVSGITGAVNVPTRQVLVYDVAGGRQMANAIALNSVTANLARIVAPSVGGVIVGSVGIGASYYAQSGFFLLATLATFLLRPLARVEPVRAPVWESIREGIRYVRGDATMTRLVLLNAIPNLLIYPYVAMMPLFARDVLHVGSEGYGLLLTGVGFGSIPGGLIVANMSHSRWKGRTMGAAALLYMGMVVLFALSTVFLLSFAILIVAGLGWSMMVTLNQTILQMGVEDAFRGRVLALYSMAGGFTPFGNLAMGASADAYGVQAAVVAFALVGFALAAVLGLGSARVRRL